MSRDIGVPFWYCQCPHFLRMVWLPKFPLKPTSSHHFWSRFVTVGTDRVLPLCSNGNNACPSLGSGCTASHLSMALMVFSCSIFYISSMFRDKIRIIYQWVIKLKTSFCHGISATESLLTKQLDISRLLLNKFRLLPSKN